ncbi:hypothetical protein ACFQ48_11595 [Hymenobacter caeli]|uniref:Uncharacterized protein n=1 Tax=Hymenobacter caeli TaxID=2735894 RepID=A0ABX2FUN0_9BACT|nr:hypothetical protein [Hymenobacter caeli]NRT20044.1 hypothetical protein [Hymenobacter caeli]
MRLFLALLVAFAGQMARGQNITDAKDGIRGVADSRQHESLVQQQNPAPNNGQYAAPPRANALPAGPATGGTYLFPYWTQGVLRSYAGPARRAWLKYNVIDRQLVARTAAGGVAVVNTDNLREFSVGDSAQGLRLTYRRYRDARVPQPKLRTAFFEVHYDAGKTALLCQRTAFPNRESVLQYFLKTSDHLLTPVKLAPRPLLAALGPAHADALAAYTEQQRLNLGRESDVARLLAYDDAL